MIALVYLSFWPKIAGYEMIKPDQEHLATTS